VLIAVLLSAIAGRDSTPLLLCAAFIAVVCLAVIARHLIIARSR
jgi:hypothetical protein